MTDKDIPKPSPVYRYDEMRRIIRDFLGGKLPFLLIVGPAGRGKSELIKREHRNRKLCIIEGHAQPFGLYNECYKHRDELIVMDDVDGLCSSNVDVRLLKVLCNTVERKTMKWLTMDKRIGNGPNQVPAFYVTTSPVCLIFNRWNAVNEDVRAVEDRATMIVRFDPPPYEVHRMVGKWFDDQEVYRFIGQKLSALNGLSIRRYVNGRTLRASGNPRWRDYLANQLGVSEELRVFNEIRTDRALRSQKDRCDEFIRRGLGCRATFYNWCSQYPLPQNVSLDLPGQRPTSKQPQWDAVEIFGDEDVEEADQSERVGAQEAQTVSAAGAPLDR